MSFDSLVSAVVAVARKADASASGQAIGVGKACHRALVAALEGIADKHARKDRRAEAVRIITSKLKAAGLRSGNVNRDVRTYHVAATYGLPAARKLPIDVLRSFGGTLQRIARHEEWVIRKKHADAFRELWARVVAGDVPSDQVAAAVRTVLGKKPPKPRAKQSPVQRVIGLVAKLGAEQQRQLYAVLHKQFADQPATVPIDAEADQAGETDQPSIRDRLLRRRAG